MEEEVALAFVADVEAAVASVRELTDAAQGVADTAKEAADGVADMTEPADAAGVEVGKYAAALYKASEAQSEFAGAQKDLTDAVERASELAHDAAASEDELAAATDKVTEAALHSADARKALADADAEVATVSGAATDEMVASGVATEETGGLMEGFGSKAKMALLGVAVGTGLAVKGAMDYQAETTRLVTSAGESAKNLGMVRQGMLALSAQTATSASDMASGMYLVESAGFHGAAGLTVLKAAAQGAKDEGADLATVSNAVTDVLVDFHRRPPRRRWRRRS